MNAKYQRVCEHDLVPAVSHEGEEPMLQSFRFSLRSWITILVDRLHAAEDARARQRGWQITRTPSGVGRLYRDPRWDLVDHAALHSVAQL